MRICGLDVGRGNVVAVCLDHKPESLYDYFQSKDFSSLRLESNIDGIRGLLSLEADLFVLEPTGSYSKFWLKQFERLDLPYLMVDHGKLNHTRRNYGFINKDDHSDALVLAGYAWDHLYSNNPTPWFLQIRDPAIDRLRELVLQIQSVSRSQHPFIARAKQALELECPEIASTKSISRSGQLKPDTPPPMWAYLSGEFPVTKNTKTRYDRLTRQTAGTGISDFTRRYASMRCHLHALEANIEAELIEIMNRPQFRPYQEVFDRFGIPFRSRAVLLSQIFPIQSYLRPDGLMDIRHTRGKNNPDKKTKKNHSLRRFKQSLGVGLVESKSGTSLNGKRMGGPDLCRRALWQFVSVKVSAPKKRSKAMGHRLSELCEFYDQQASTHGQARHYLTMARTASRAAEWLFKDLVNHICPKP